MVCEIKFGVQKLEQELSITKSEIQMWKDRLSKAEAEIPLADAAGYARAQKEYERMMEELMDRLLSKIHQAFGNKLTRLFRTWQSGQRYLFFSDWRDIVRNKPKVALAGG